LIEAVPAQRQRFRMANTAEDYQRLADYVRGTAAPVLIGFEATGNYHRPLAYFLQRQGFQLRLIPALALERTGEAMSNSSWRTTRRWLSRLRQRRSLPRASARRTSDTSSSP
jgi:transposase